MTSPYNLLIKKKPTVNGVVLEQVDQVVQVHEWVVDGSDSGLASVLSEGRAEGQATNAAEAVDSESNVGHILCDE
jgi:hypothetical protein